MLCDYHLHSEFSFDSSEKIENICKKAVEEGISEIAVTDHAELPLRENTPWPDFERRAEIIRACSGHYNNKLTIRSGVEIGQPWRSSEMEKKITDLRPDFIIASVHELDGFPDPREIKYTENTIPVVVKALRITLICTRNCFLPLSQEGKE